MLKHLTDIKTLKQMTPQALQDYSDAIAVFMAKETHFPIETIVKNLNVLELTLALHTVYDFQKDRLIFDEGDQVMTHKIVTGREDQLRLRTNIPLTLDLNNIYDAYAGGDVGEGLGVGVAYALESAHRTVIVLNDYALNYGPTYEALVKISKFRPDITLVLVDVQQSLLRHNSTFDSLIKSVRISKAYVGLKKDMKAVLDSNPISRPLFNTLVKVRDALKESVLEPTVFTQFGIDYQGPIDGQNITELLKVLKLSKTLKGPQLIHVQTRLSQSKRKNLEFPSFKTHKENPATYRYYHQQFDKVLVGTRDPKLMVFVDAMQTSDHFLEFQKLYPHNYHMVTGGTQNLVTMASGYALQGYRVVLAITSQRALQIQASLIHQFEINNLPLTLLIRECGLNAAGNPYKQGIYDYSMLHYRSQIYMGKDLMQSATLLEHLLNKPGIQVLRYENKSEKRTTPTLTLEKDWQLVCPFSTTTQAVVLTLGQAVVDFETKIINNQLPIALIQCIKNRSVDLELLKKIHALNVPLIIYNIEDIDNHLKTDVLLAAHDAHLNLNIRSYDLTDKDLKHNSKELKRMYGLHLDDVLNAL